MMKQLFFALAFTTGVSYAQDYRTGDADLDANLKIVNTKGKENLSDFKLDLSKRFEVPLQKVEDCFTAGMNPGDAFMALQVASIQQIPVDNVIKVYKTDKSKGWGTMAQELGIKPGSAEFHALKGKAKEHSNGNAGKGKGQTKANGKGKENGKGKSGASSTASSSKGNSNGKATGKATGKSTEKSAKGNSKK
ncbi:MAG: hypothetical protein KF704_08195 [Crocinitomicaceae bacterium]|nr:hypothetical protein [Crocinitomicaceae bacterium]